MPKRPNVLVFFTDQQRWDCSSLHGNPLDLMPNFDRLAQAGTHLANAFTCQPVCGPARSCFQTGRYATQTGCWTNGRPLPLGSKTMAHHFKDAGYDTGYIGKWHLAEPELGWVPEEKRGGYDYWMASNVLEFTSTAYDVTLFNNDNEAVKPPGYRVDALADTTINYINEHQEKPWFLFTSYIEPHHQNHTDDYPAPEGYYERYQNRWVPPDLQALGGSTHQHIAGYYGMVKRLDEALGRVYDALRSTGQLDNTVILFTSDHGNHFKTRNGEYKRSCHDASIHVPSMIHGPGFMSGGRLDQLVSLIDFPPTLLDAAGIDIPDDYSGNSILKLVQDKSTDWQDDIYVQISEAQNGRAIRTERWKYCVDSPDGVDENGCSTSYKEQYLYDLQSDPYELRNLVEIETFGPLKEKLQGKLKARMAAIGEPECDIISATKNGGGQRYISPTEVASLGFEDIAPIGKYGEGCNTRPPRKNAK